MQQPLLLLCSYLAVIAPSPQVCRDFPAVTIVTSEIDRGINQDFVVVPGIGEFGDRFFST